MVTSKVLGQSKMILNDQAGFITPVTEEYLKNRFEENGITLTSTLDFRDQCDYYIVSITSNVNDAVVQVKKCSDELIGTKSISRKTGDIPEEERSILLYYGILEIIEHPGSSEESLVTLPPTSTEHDSRYFFAPSAYPLKKGEFYYNTMYFLVHDVQVGVHDHISMGFGTTIIGYPMYLTAKASLPVNKNLQFAVGDMLILGTFGSDFVGNLVFGTTTMGSQHSNASIGLGYLGTNDSDISNQSGSMVVNVAAIGRLSDYVYLLTENYFFGLDQSEYAYYYQDPVNYTGYIQREYTRNNRYWYGIVGIRIVRRANELASWQFGMTYVRQEYAEVPSRYRRDPWQTDPPTGSEMIGFPTLSYTRKFQLGK